MHSLIPITPFERSESENDTLAHASDSRRNCDSSTVSCCSRSAESEFPMEVEPTNKAPIAAVSYEGIV